MKKLKLLYVLSIAIFLTSCIVVDNTPGPRGIDGRAFFSVDYERHAPYSYWDNNPSIPYNPILGEFYISQPGIYDFEYFINPYDYWYGTYEVWVNPGGPGGPHGEPGYDGADTYLTLICDPRGFHEHRDNWKDNLENPLIIEKNEGKLNIKITIQKGNILTRPAQEPKYKGN